MADKRENGFVLVEVLAAFAILSITLIVLSDLLSSGVRNAETVRAKTEALGIAQSVLASAGREAPLEQGTIEGAAPNGQGWVLHISPYEAGGPAQTGAVRGYWLEIKVYGDPDRKRSPLISLRTLKLGRANA